MSLDLLDTPVRLTWDFSGEAAGQGAKNLPGIAEAIVDGGVFFVTLQGKPLLHPGIDEVLELLGGGCQLLLTCHGGQEELATLDRLSSKRGQLLLELSPFVDENSGVDADRLLDAVQSLREMQYEPVFALTPLRKNLRNIPDIMRFCMEHQVAKFKLPNAHIGDSFHEYSAEDLPRWQDLEAFRKVWSDFTETGTLLPALEIHDLFLWEIMTPGAQQNRTEYGGCQAGNSLGHVDFSGVVHPCAAWPQPLGSLPEQSLEDVWAGSERLAVCESIARMPDGCQGCGDLEICFGGCRGLARHLNRSAGERDLMCSGPRLK